MRNLFDQYSQPENRLTHALLSALDRDRKLLAHFLRELVDARPRMAVDKLGVLEQQYPGESEPNEDQLDRRGIPDGWIYDEEGWCVFIETKVLAKLNKDQVERHRRTAARRGFDDVTAVVIVPRKYASLPDKVVPLEWRTIHAWLRKHSDKSAWANTAADYIEIVEERLVTGNQLVEGQLTMFTGFLFGPDHAYTYIEGKRLLNLALGELRQRVDLKTRLRMNPEITGRPAITAGEDGAVWNFLSMSAASDADQFTKYPHLTLGINARAIEVMVTLPHSLNTQMRANIKELGEPKFQSLLACVVDNMGSLLKKCPGATPWFRGVQRRYPSQRARPFLDAQIDFDLRTTVRQSGAPKVQPRWLSAGYGSFVEKEGSNYQFQVGVLFRYEKCPELRNRDALDLVAEGWLACKPIVDVVQR